MDIGLIGLGSIGSAMARNLAAAGHREAAGAADRVLPMLDAAHARMAEAVDAGWSDLDWSAMARFTIENGQHP
jgi:3-hydroxyisobutyrate dehydrogenase-like beta-hydroxyacid dehydrogenase